MQKSLSLICFVLLFTGCTGSYHANGNKELNEAEKIQRFKELELSVAGIKVGDPVTLILYNGDTVDGTFYSYMDGLISVRMGDAFRDTELTDIRDIEHRSQDRTKKIMIGLMFLTVAGILAEFIATH